MNVFFVFDDGSVATPPIAGTILEGITRASLLRLAQDEGLSVREEPYAIEQWRADASSGQLREAFACGTAAVVTSIGQVRSASGDFTIGAGGPGQITERLRERLTGIQRGTLPDPHNWVHRIG
jgi:branched-chain amino acid aminotransferase